MNNNKREEMLLTKEYNGKCIRELRVGKDSSLEQIG